MPTGKDKMVRNILCNTDNKLYSMWCLPGVLSKTFERFGQLSNK